MPNEADTCRRFVVPKLQAAGWEDEPHRINEQATFTDGRIVMEIAEKFGGSDRLIEAVRQLQTLLYAA